MARSATTARHGASAASTPGWPVLTGRGEVLRSYALIMANTDYVQFFLTDVEVSVMGDTALVTCTENILSGGPAEEDGSARPAGGPASSSPRMSSGAPARTSWKLWSHHGSPVWSNGRGRGRGRRGRGRLDDGDIDL